jgi:hypothetical protein
MIPIEHRRKEIVTAIFPPRQIDAKKGLCKYTGNAFFAFNMESAMDKNEGNKVCDTTCTTYVEEGGKTGDACSHCSLPPRDFGSEKPVDETIHLTAELSNN